MIIKDFKDHLYQTLSPLYDVDEINGIYARLLEHLFNFGRAEAVLQYTLLLDQKQQTFAKEAIARLKKSEPIQYILGYTDFCGLRFNVCPDVLIPRPETEELIYWITSQFEKNTTKRLQILDIGTGSGCIAVSLAKLLPNTEVSAMDISGEALHIAQENARNNQVLVHFIKADILKTDSLETTFDIIVSNPPYVLLHQKLQMQQNVLNFEPHRALFVPDINPLIFYEKITDLAREHLNINGTLFFEINEAFAGEVQDLLAAKGFMDIQLKADLYGKNRMIKGKKY